MTAQGYAEDAAVGDLDNDGLSGDVALAMASGHNVTVVRLVGNHLQSPVTYPTGTNPVAVAVGDVNGDRLTDLITANAGTFRAGTFTPGSLSLLRGKADGTFGTASTLTAGSSPGDVGLGDFNSDGKLDLAVANGSNLEGAAVTQRSVIVRLGLGDGGFGPEIPVPTAQRTLALQVVDFNGDVDGHDDIVTTGSVLLGRGDGSFAAPINVAPGIDPLVVKVEDINQDNKSDLVFVTVTRSNLATILPGHGDGTVDSPQHYLLNNSAYAVAYYDVDGDGASDLLFTGGSEATLLPGRGESTFRGVRALPSVSHLTGQSSATAAAVADFTGDSIPDVAVANGGTTHNGALSGNAAAILPGLGGGKFGDPLAIPGLPGASVVTGDWNGDAKPDLALVGTGGSSSALTIALGLGEGAFGPPNSTPLPGTQSSAPPIPSILTTFLNHDAAPDLLVGNLAVDEVSVFLGNGRGGFTTQAPVLIGTAPVVISNASPPGLAVGDFNKDTHPDVVVAYEGDFGKLNGGMKMAFGKGDGTFQPPQILRGAVAGKGVAAADFNKDGNLDLALAMQMTFGWDVAVYQGRGDGSFAPPMPLGLNETLLSGVIVLDADQDGKPDLGVACGGDEVLALRGLGDGTFAFVLRAPTGGGAVLTADLNQDGFPDMLAPNGFLGIYVNEIPALRQKYPLLQIAHVADKITLRWPDFFPDFVLHETPALSGTFTPSTRKVSTKNGSFQVEVDPVGAPAEFFRLEPKK